MKKIHYVRTNGYDMLVTYDSESKIVRYLNECDVTSFLGHLDQVEDDSGWDMEEDVEDLEKWLNLDGQLGDPSEILETIEFE